MMGGWAEAGAGAVKDEKEKKSPFSFFWKKKKKSEERQRSARGQRRCFHVWAIIENIRRARGTTTPPTGNPKGQPCDGLGW